MESAQPNVQILIRVNLGNLIPSFLNLVVGGHYIYPAFLAAVNAPLRVMSGVFGSDEGFVEVFRQHLLYFVLLLFGRFNATLLVVQCANDPFIFFYYPVVGILDARSFVP
jgi:hypothetical protein